MPHRYHRVFRRDERAALIDELSVRTGFSAGQLRVGTLKELQQLLDRSRHEVVIDELQARKMLDPYETQRVHDFFAGEETSRTLLDGLVPVRTFLDCFLLWSGEGNSELLRNGRSLRDVVETIRLEGGLAAAARRTPWLSSAVGLVNHFSHERLQRQRMFVRHAIPREALSVEATCTHGSQPIYIEEGQHRAMAAAWVLTHGGTEEPEAQRSIPYIRGVNRRGSMGGDAFWQLHGMASTPSAEWRPWHVAENRFPKAELLSGAVCVLLTYHATRTCLRYCGARRPYLRKARCFSQT